MNKKMKVLILVNQLLTTCGVSKHILYFLKEMKGQSDFEFSILCGGGDAIDAYKNFCKEVRVDYNIRYENRSYLKYFVSTINLFRIIRKNKYDIVHSHSHYGANISRIVCYFTGVKDVQTVHGIIDPVGKLKHYPATYFIAVNEHIKEYLIKKEKKLETKIRLIRCGIPFNDNNPKKINSKLRVIAAGRLNYLKGFDLYIKAVSKLPGELFNKAEFLLAGKGEAEDELLALSDQLNANISFLGQIKDLTKYLKTTDILVNPSRSSNEGFPLTIIEAALTKNLIISSNFLGYDSILRDNENCLIFEKDNADELLEKFTFSIENFNKLNKVTESLYRYAKTEFSPEKMVEETKTFYKEIIFK